MFLDNRSMPFNGTKRAKSNGRAWHVQLPMAIESSSLYTRAQTCNLSLCYDQTSSRIPRTTTRNKLVACSSDETVLTAAFNRADMKSLSSSSWRCRCGITENRGWWGWWRSCGLTASSGFWMKECIKYLDMVSTYEVVCCIKFLSPPPLWNREHWKSLW